MKKYLLFIFCIFAVNVLFAQLNQHAFTQDYTINAADSNNLYLSIVNQNIIKNNEYFNHLTHGYTMLGTQMNLQIKYFPTENTMMEGGIHMLYYYGLEKFARVLPLVRFSYTPFKGMYVVLGNIYGGLNHHYPEPMYKFERFMEDPPETGFQFLYDNKWFDVDFYINWRYFLLLDDKNHKEIFTAGISTNVNLINPKYRFQIKIPLQYLYNHHGGQLDTLHQPLTTLVNTDVGVKLSYDFNGFVNKAGAVIYYLTYKDASGEKRQPFKDGYGWLPEIFVNSELVNLHAGYWKGNHYFAPIGQQLFSSVSDNDRYPGALFPEREVFYYKFDFHHTIAKGIFLGVRYEGYLDLLGNIVGPDDGHHDFSYGIFLNFNRDFFLLKTK